MGRHSVTADRRRVSVLLGAFASPAIVFMGVGANLSPDAERPEAQVAPAPEPAAPYGMELVAGAAPALAWMPASADPVAVQPPPASRYRIVDTAKAERILHAGDAPESGLQVKTILAARSISAAFPEINQIGGVRSDALRWHPNGLALDVMIPNPMSAEGIALGNEIVAFVLKNAERFGMQDAIWRGRYITPSGVRNGGYGHFDHVHITTTGGGYPTGDELYFR
ncbi:hypothetical protein [Mycolicibacterium arseniciresistens]|uniref:ARB-07466-like C-terminal domain-containing protein n=1 Tax=Mycolicibacterium arseniciresistens TaxID=3062257 RepID=A0ABT8UF74_9MYCO|nr:hypothetical protein [Mycolicibacterium arseniciresistens]MDO3636429.1 hypothetical protein [Mycolicibacterium arseniciresistens]